MSTGNVEPEGVFASVQRETTLVDRVAAQIQELILSGKLPAGTALPAEREIARQIGVSRTVVREAARSLVAKGLLQPQTGRGNVVTKPSTELVSRSMALLIRSDREKFDYGLVSEVRRVLEVEIARLAALRRTEEDLERLRSVLQEAEMSQADRDRFAALDVAFHSALAQATQNNLFQVLLDSIADVMITVRQLGYGTPGMPARALAYHTAIFQHVAAQDAGRAIAAMQEHLDESAATIASALIDTKGER
ncbi:MAG: FadR/GntR family transcriptional regulator [Nitrososphaerales archaeon]